jgi:hypothetical protein
VVLNPGNLLDASGAFGEAQGGAGVGPDVAIEGLELPEVSLDLGLARDPGAPASSGLGALLGSLLGGVGR